MAKGRRQADSKKRAETSSARPNKRTRPTDPTTPTSLAAGSSPTQDNQGPLYCGATKLEYDVAAMTASLPLAKTLPVGTHRFAHQLIFRTVNTRCGVIWRVDKNAGSQKVLQKMLANSEMTLWQAVEAVDADAIAEGKLNMCVRWVDVVASKATLEQDLGEPTEKLRLSQEMRESACGYGGMSRTYRVQFHAGKLRWLAYDERLQEQLRRYSENRSFVRGIEQLGVWLTPKEYEEMMTIEDLDERFDWMLQRCLPHVIKDLELPAGASEVKKRSYVITAYLLAQKATPDERARLLHYASKIETSLNLTASELERRPSAFDEETAKCKKGESPVPWSSSSIEADNLQVGKNSSTWRTRRA